MSQFDEFSSPSETTYIEAETGDERSRTYEAPAGLAARTGSGDGAPSSANAQPDVTAHSSGAPVRAVPASAQGGPQRGSFAGPQRGGTLVAAQALLSDSEGLRRQWESVQVGFVDDPRRAVGEADSLVSSVIDELVDGFRQQHYSMEAQWSEGKEVSTDELREAFQRYREFFERLLKV